MKENNEFNYQDLNNSSNEDKNEFSYTPSYTPEPPQQNQNSGLAIAAFVLGILSLLCCGSGVFSILAIVFYFVDKKNNNGVPNSLARIGMICGIVSLALTIVAYIVYIAAIVIGAFSGALY